MRGRIALRAFALGCAGLIVVGIAGCEQSKPDESGTAKTDLKIVEQIPIGADGKALPVPEVAGAVNPAGDGKAVCSPLSIAMAGALTGPDAALGKNIQFGAQLAINKHNEANPGCQVQLKTFDTEGDAQKATQVAPQILEDAFTVGLIGPAFSGETEATGDIFNQAGLVAATASATRVTLSEKGWKTFFRGLGNDGAQGEAVANYLTNTLGYKKICVIDDSTPYGLGLADVVRKTLGPAAEQSCNGQVKKGDKDFSATVTNVKSASPDAVFYGGYYAEAAPLVQQLRDGGVTATFVSADGTNDPQFVTQAGEASKGAILSCPCSPSPADFAEQYKKVSNGVAPGVYSTEGYDLATIMLKGIDSGKVTRPALLDYVKNYDGQGVARKYKWTDTGELTDSLIWIYKVQ